MPTIAIVGAGPGLGLSIAKVFGGHGFQVALISRSKEKLDGLVGELTAAGITAAGFAADVADRPALSGALEQAAAHFGAVDVLEYSPYGGLTQIGPLEMTVGDVNTEMDHQLHGAVTAAGAVLPAMLDAGAGTLLFTTGGGAINPYPMLAPTNAAQAALRNWVFNVRNVLTEKGIYAGTVAINVFIGAAPPAPGIPFADPDEIAQAYWELHARRDKPEHVING